MSKIVEGIREFFLFFLTGEVFELFLFGVFVTLAGFLTRWLFDYLSPELREEKNSTAKMWKLHKKRRRVRRPSSIPERPDESEGVGRRDKLELVDEIKRRLVSISSTEFLEEIQSRLSEKLESRLVGELIERRFQKIYDRLNQEVSNLVRRGNVNLFLGIVMSISGFMLLLYFVAVDDVGRLPPGNSWGVFSNFLPRMSIVVLIEVFAYFFLGLYRSSLNEIKYFQNEITNIESKILSLLVSLQMERVDAADGALGILVRTERNFLLKKGESTADLERHRVEEASSQLYLGVLSDIMGQFRHRDGKQ